MRKGDLDQTLLQERHYHMPTVHLSSTAPLFLQIVHILSYTHVCTYINMDLKGGCNTLLIPPPPASTPNNGYVTLAQSSPRGA